MLNSGQAVPDESPSDHHPDVTAELAELRRINRELFTQLLESNLEELPRSAAAAGAVVRQAECAEEAAEERMRDAREQIGQLAAWCIAREAELAVHRQRVIDRELELDRLRTLERSINDSVSMRVARILRLPTRGRDEQGA